MTLAKSTGSSAASPCTILAMAMQSLAACSDDASPDQTRSVSVAEANDRRRWRMSSGTSPGSSMLRPGVSIIFREQGNRFIAAKFSVRGRDLAGAVAEAQ